MSALGGEADVIRSKADIDLKSMNRRPLLALALILRSRGHVAAVNQGTATPRMLGGKFIFKPLLQIVRIPRVS